MDKKPSIFLRFWRFITSIPRKLLSIFSLMGIIPKILLLLLLPVLLFFGYKWMTGDFSSIVETQLTVIESPSILEEVRAIGELIGAEYYGEEVHSLSEAYEEEDKQNMENSYLEIKTSYQLLYDRIGKMRDVNGNLIGHEYHLEKAFSDFMADHTTAQNYDKAWFSIFRQINGISNQEMLEKLRTTTWEQFYARHGSILESERRRLRKMRNDGTVLIYLARGVAKAGFELDSLTEDSFEKRNDTLIIHELEAKILNADINPWFVLPQASEDGKGIPGYEVLKEYGSPTHAQHELVKKGCKKDLIASALKQKILETAEERAEETLLNFLNLLARDSTEVLQVVDIQAK